MPPKPIQQTVFCMKWGTAYDARDVNILFAMSRRNAAPGLRFICLTDDDAGLHPEIEARPLPFLNVPPAFEHQPWRKLVAGAALTDLDGDALYLDLDLVLRDDLAAFFSYQPGRFCIIHDWSHPERNEGNSSVYRFRPRDFAGLAADFEANADEIVHNFPNEQVWLTEQARRHGEIAFWPDGWCVSFKRHCLGGRLRAALLTAREPATAKIVVFHGHPKPREAIKGEWKGRLKRMRPTPWIAKHWCETDQ